MFAAASHWCNHLGPHPTLDDVTNAAGRGLADHLAAALPAGERDALIAAVAARRLDPYTAADRLFAGASAALAGAAIPLAGSSGI